ncbi:MAG: ABC transporter permease subunit [Bifidobacterium aquikefiri]|uniref:Maltose/maltodextrin transport system permease protein n=1 Tax=Bifidobacterium aquikefiri TaxID=1653207 RepID=A0A261G3C3_9BIFI|nr:ABC transporter permease subunit [Bifidobacterium aquikefiri]OZG65725.1 maltose ABC transporter permease [Bifidobacterium aquikefiri]
MIQHDSSPSRKDIRKKKQANRVASQASTRIGTMLIKIVLLGLVDALSAYSAFMLAEQGNWIILSIVVATTIVVNWIYFRRDGLVAKYLTPGLIFLLIFQLFAICYSTYIAFTDYGTGHNSTKEQAISSLIQSSQRRVQGSASYKISIVECGKTLNFLVTMPHGEAQIGSEKTPLHEVASATKDDAGQAVSTPGCSTLSFNDLLSRQDEVTSMRVPMSADSQDGTLKTADGQTALVYKSLLKYDAAKDIMINTQTRVRYYDTGVGAFTSKGGSRLSPGWQINVGISNFRQVFTSQEMRGPFLQVLVWTIEFSVISVASTFVLGLLLALVFNNSRMKGRAVYRSILILPYAFPAFLSALVWQGLLNEKFGYINQVLLHGVDIPWLESPALAKIAVLIVNLWLGFPYMFLVSMGALQSIPKDLSEAAELDGANAWQIFRLIKFPLLLVSIAPLLISSFAMNFNNFNLIYMLTNGGPINANTNMNVGSTDILISMVYKIAFVGADRNYGLASAFSIIIFIVVAVVSAIGFRASRSLEELN